VVEPSAVSVAKSSTRATPTYARRGLPFQRHNAAATILQALMTKEVATKVRA